MLTYRIKFESPQKALGVDGYATTYGGHWKTGLDGWAFYTFSEDVLGEVVQELQKDEDVLEFEDITRFVRNTEKED